MWIDISITICSKTSRVIILPHVAVQMEDASQVVLRDSEPSGSHSFTGLGCKVPFLKSILVLGQYTTSTDKGIFYLVCILNTVILGVKEMENKSDY